MHTFTPPFLLMRRNGTTLVFEDMAALKAAISGVISISKYHVIHLTEWGAWRTPNDILTGEWIVRDDAGRIVSEDHIYPQRHRKYISTGMKMKAHAAALGLPIPYTGKRRGWSYYRRPQSVSVYRAKAALVDERDEMRPKGKIKLPPNDWDDIGRSDVRDRNWKRFRKTQWKE